MDVASCLRRCFSLLPPWTTAGLQLLLASSTSTTCLYDYDLPLRLPSTTYLYGLPLRPASTACLYGLPLRSVYVVIVIVIVHPLFKWNVYLSLYVIDMYFFFLEIIFLSFLLLIVQLKDVICYLLLLTQPLPCFAYPCLFYFC